MTDPTQIDYYKRAQEVEQRHIRQRKIWWGYFILWQSLTLGLSGFLVGYLGWSSVCLLLGAIASLIFVWPSQWHEFCEKLYEEAQREREEAQRKRDRST
jgi:Ca2+-dependent lipid-binding protein